MASALALLLLVPFAFFQPDTPVMTARDLMALPAVAVLICATHVSRFWIFSDAAHNELVSINFTRAPYLITARYSSR